MEDFLNQYGPTVGYLILLFGSFIEGESVVLTVSFLAYKGYFNIYLVTLIAFIGTLAADQTMFFVGRAYGPGLLERKPKLKERSKKIFDLLHRHQIIFILTFRFIYGIRNASPIVIGAAGIPVRRFIMLNVISAAVWAVISCGGGYLLGYYFSDEIDYVIQQAIKFQHITIGAIIGVVATFILLRMWRKKRARKLRKND